MSDQILKQILYMNNPWDWAKKEQLYNRYWSERKKEFLQLYPEGQNDIKRMLRNICKNFDKDDNDVAKEIIEAEEAEYEQQRQQNVKGSISIMNSDKLEDIVDAITKQYQKNNRALKEGLNTKDSNHLGALK